LTFKPEDNKMSIIKVASQSRTALVAGAIAGMYREKQAAVVQAIGAGAVNQAIKAMISARGFLAEEGKYIVFIPSFTTVMVNGQERTAIRMTVQAQESSADATTLETDETPMEWAEEDNEEMAYLFGGDQVVSRR
jgi:stage V sporulation protein S